MLETATGSGGSFLVKSHVRSSDEHGGHLALWIPSPVSEVVNVSRPQIRGVLLTKLIVPLWDIILCPVSPSPVNPFGSSDEISAKKLWRSTSERRKLCRWICVNGSLCGRLGTRPRASHHSFLYSHLKAGHRIDRVLRNNKKKVSFKKKRLKILKKRLKIQKKDKKSYICQIKSVYLKLWIHCLCCL